MTIEEFEKEFLIDQIDTYYSVKVVTVQATSLYRERAVVSSPLS